MCPVFCSWKYPGREKREEEGDNLTLAGKIIQWPIQSELCYDYDAATRAICKVLSTYVNYLVALRDSVESDVSSKIDEYIRFWNKELHYKMEHRLESDTK